MPVELKVGAWYIVVTCKHCSTTLYLFRDLSEGKGSSSATYSILCPVCRHKGEYEARHHKHSQTS